MRAWVTTLLVGAAGTIACVRSSPEGSPVPIGLITTDPDNNRPVATATAEVTRTLVPPSPTRDMITVAPITVAPTPDRAKITPPATPEKNLEITGTKEGKTLMELRTAISIDAKVNVISESPSLKIAVVLPELNGLYGESYLLMAGPDGKWFRPDAIESMADPNGNIMVRKTTYGEGTKGGNKIYTVSLDVPFATQKKADFAQCVETGRASDYKIGCTDGLVTLPDRRHYIAYSLGNKVVALREIAPRGKVFLAGDKGFPLTADNGSSPEQVAFAGDIATLGALDTKSVFVVNNNGEVLFSDRAPAEAIFGAPVEVPGLGTIDLNEKLLAMQKIPPENVPHGMATRLDAFGESRVGKTGLPVSEIFMDPRGEMAQNGELAIFYVGNPITEGPWPVTVTVFKNSPVEIVLVKKNGSNIDYVPAPKSFTYKDILKMRSLGYKVILVGADLIGGESTGSYHINGPYNSQNKIGIFVQ